MAFKRSRKANGFRSPPATSRASLPDGSLIYFVATGAIYAVRVDAQAEPFAVWEPREPRLSLAAVNPAALDLGIARDKLVVLLAESNFNLWMADRVVASR